ncbi:MAG: DUF2795 domain-containing protein [Candidatus Levybacteria bacterium]|nr:DUF2795 domain-containing protein [Candidatus Levybacteria bacterium]
MTQQQWDQHIDHLQNHVDWPANKTQVIAACSGEDVEASVMDELRSLPDKTYQNEGEIKKALVS